MEQVLCYSIYLSDEYDCKFIYDVVDDVMMSDISKWWLVIMQHSSLLLAVIMWYELITVRIIG